MRVQVSECVTKPNKRCAKPRGNVLIVQVNMKQSTGRAMVLAAPVFQKTGSNRLLVPEPAATVPEINQVSERDGRKPQKNARVNKTALINPCLLLVKLLLLPSSRASNT